MLISVMLIKKTCTYCLKIKWLRKKKIMVAILISKSAEVRSRSAALFCFEIHIQILLLKHEIL